MLPRRSVLTALAGFGALTALAACGEDSTPAVTPSATGGAAGADAFPVTVEHALGAAVIPAQPTRVATVGFNDQDFALALGVTPVVTRGNLSYDANQRPWARDLLPADPIPEAGTDTLNLEAIAAQTPDLVLGCYSFLDRTTYEALDKIAPTVADLASEGGLQSASWQDQLTATGKALGLSAEATALREKVEQVFADHKAENPSFAGRTLNLVMPYEGGFYVLGSEDLRTQMFSGLGFELPLPGGQLSAEQVDRLTSDVLVVLGGTQAEIAAVPVAAALPVVAENRTVYLGAFEGDVPAAIGYSSPLSLPFALDAVVPQLAAVTRA
ncbi:ABC transporter substrate-binding protein [Kineococcus gynurae]|uniref:ABC transporter substrate-binding protein n=1 Tax=Kineococcus gynurae TaxID=452979 RepID=A0ABV5LTM6_9ACTN